MTLTTAAKISAAYMLAVVLAGMSSDLIGATSSPITTGSSPELTMAASLK